MIEKDKMTKDEAKALIGRKYEIQGRRRDIATITSLYFIYDINEDLIAYQFNSEHQFMGKTLINYDISYTSIKRGLIQDG